MSLPSEEECDRYLIEQRGYTTRDIEACAQLRRSLDEAGEKGLDARDLHKAHAQLQEPQSGCTKSLQQYLKVNPYTLQSLSRCGPKVTQCLKFE